VDAAGTWPAHIRETAAGQVYDPVFIGPNRAFSIACRAIYGPQKKLRAAILDVILPANVKRGDKKAWSPAC
jgi:hypothetical protein